MSSIYYLLMKKTMREKEGRRELEEGRGGKERQRKGKEKRRKEEDEEDK